MIDKKWAQETLEKIDKKITAEAERMAGIIPYVPNAKGRYEDFGKRDIAWWTNGFWGGLLWQLYQATGKEVYRTRAQELEDRMDQAIVEFDGLYHDVGFMWMHMSVANYRLTGNVKSKSRGMHMATLLAGRYNPLGHFIRAWNEDKAGWIIIDCLMNLPLLYWASEENGDPRFRAIAEEHAHTAMKVIQREDGSCNHIAIMDPMNGDVLEYPAGQGYESGSSWSRGQSWAVYGFALSYIHTKNKEYLDAAIKTADYFVECVEKSNWLPLCDFRQPAEPVYYDATAGAIASCGLLEISKHVDGELKEKYENAAMNIMKAMCENWCDFDESNDGFLTMGKVAYSYGFNDVHDKIVYGDYFFTEAVLRMLDKHLMIW